MLKHRVKVYCQKLVNKIVLVAGDFLALEVCFFFAYEVRKICYHMGLLDLPNPTRAYFAPYLYVLFIYIAMFFIFHLYSVRFSFWAEVQEIVKAIIVGIVVIFFILAMLKVSHQASRFIIIAMGLSAILLIPLGKRLVKYFLYRIKLWQINILIIANADEFFNAYYEELRHNWYVGYRPARVIDISTIDESALNNLLSKDRLQSIITSQGIVLPILYKLNKEYFYDIFIRLDLFFEDLKLVPDFHSLFINNLRVENDGNNLLINFENKLQKFENRAMQYLLNKVLSVCFFIALSPVMLFIALLVKADSPGPVIYRARRIGRGDRDILVYKFRTMYRDAEQKLNALLASDKRLRKEFHATFKLKNDPRITRIGKFLRKTSLDELPQLFNVLQGQMNIVGPRPIVRNEVVKYGSAFDELVKVQPGMTGLWQVSGRNDIDYQKRVQLDLFYIKNWSPWMDIMIMFKTALVILRGRGAY